VERFHSPDREPFEDEEQDPPAPRLAAGKRTLTQSLARGGGAPLPAASRGPLEQALGTGLGGVRIHTDDRAAATARAYSARAIAINEDIIFGAGQFQPDTAAGRHLLAHEVAHTVQQRDGAAAQAKPLEVSTPGDACEREADAFADAFSRGDAVLPAVSRGAAPMIARAPAHDADGVRSDASMEGWDYFRRHQQTLLNRLGGPLGATRPLDLPPYVSWASYAGLLLGAKVWNRLLTTDSAWIMMEGYVPGSIAAIINNARGAGADGKGDGELDQAVVDELGAQLRLSILESIARLLPSYMRTREPLMLEADLARRDPEDAQPDPTSLMRTRPIDWPVAEVLCTPNVVRFDVDAWRNDHPGSSSAPETITDCVEGDRFEDFEPSFHALDTWGPASEGRDAIALAQVRPDAVQLAPAEASGMLDEAIALIDRMVAACGPLALDAEGLGVLREQLIGRANEIDGGGAEQWLSHVPQQVAMLARAGDGLLWVAEEYRERAAASTDDAFIEPIRHVGNAYVRAAVASDMRFGGRELLDDADRMRTDLPAQLMNLMLARIRMRLDVVDQGKVRRTKNYVHLVLGSNLNERLAYLHQREVELRGKVAQLREALAFDPVGVIAMMETLPVELEWIEFETDLIYTVDRWEAYMRLIRDNPDDWPDPERDPKYAEYRGRWLSMVETVKEDGAGFGALWEKVTGYQGNIIGQRNSGANQLASPAPYREQFAALQATSSLEERIKSALELLEENHTKQQIREFAKTLGFLALAWYAAPIAGAGAVTGGAGAVRGGAGLFAAGRWLFSGSRAVAGRWAVATNLAGQMMAHGTEFDDYNWGSLTADYIFGTITQAYAKAVQTRWRVFGKGVQGLDRVKNFGRQQAAFFLYGYLVNTLRAQIANTDSGKQVTAGQVDGFLSMVKSLVFQRLEVSKWGRAVFPGGKDDPKLIAIEKSVSFIQKLSVSHVFGTVAGNGGDDSTGGLDLMPPDLEFPEFEVDLPFDPSKPPPPEPAFAP
jgi:hypothetical protein